MKTCINWLPSFAFAVFGAVFLYAAINIGDSFSGGSSHKVMPLFVSALVLALSGYVLFFEQVRGDGGQSSSETQPIQLATFVTRVSPLLLLMVLNGFGQIWFGYLVATFFCGICVFRLFENSWAASAIHGAIGAAVLYLLFFGLLQLYDPPGTILDLSIPI